MKFKRICLIILDSLGIGELPDASAYDDSGANTLKHLEDRLGALKIPNLIKLGIGAAGKLEKTKSPAELSAFFGRMREVSKGKDTTTGHWEMMGLPLKDGLSLFPEGFPPEILNEFTRRTGLEILGNKPASGTIIIDELGEEHLKTGKAIVYTSGDSVFQIAWHEGKFGLDRLYQICEIARDILDKSPYKVGRVIARPFLGNRLGEFKRTGNRRDFSIAPYGKSALNHLADGKHEVVGVGKIPYIFDFQGITKPLEAHNDQEAIDATIAALKSEKNAALIFTNLNDLDMVYGHRRNIEGYAKHLEFIDTQLPKILEVLQPDDLLLISADHGNDTTYKGTDHTREYVPLLAYSPRFKAAPAASRKLPDRMSFADIGQSLCENFNIKPISSGKSFLAELS